ncbi:hypothetical protein SMSP2_01781 [Limihaloglobus sulfuriphilus]|uniref:Uncharacterized protein n=1 Tax=Limihaloglobus sulfuriphilus TaxID=1851148 RepID=A0A1Q2MGH2_9BACT|nr:hypothetical protein [Limihaloglobus sulfuriphilus]AQQ71407.1 hypothetical protein SMSP2_01781 [Limihaloglobus sulfuriphilus]
MTDDKLNQTYNDRKQDISNLMSLLREELDQGDNILNWTHVGDLGHIKEELINIYGFASNIPAEDIEKQLEQYRKTNTYPGFSDDLEQLADRIGYCRYVSERSIEAVDTSLALHYEQNVKHLTDVLNDVENGKYSDAYQGIEELHVSLFDHIPERLREYLKNYAE